MRTLSRAFNAPNRVTPSSTIAWTSGSEKWTLIFGQPLKCILPPHALA